MSRRTCFLACTLWTMLAFGLLTVCMQAAGLHGHHCRHHGPGVPCIDGVCIPNRPSFGYYSPLWRKWPGHQPPDLRPDGKDGGALPDIPPIDLPFPQDEHQGGAVRREGIPGLEDAPDVRLDPPPLPPINPEDGPPIPPPGIRQDRTPFLDNLIPNVPLPEIPNLNEPPPPSRERRRRQGSLTPPGNGNRFSVTGGSRSPYAAPMRASQATATLPWARPTSPDNTHRNAVYSSSLRGNPLRSGDANNGVRPARYDERVDPRRNPLRKR